MPSYNSACITPEVLIHWLAVSPVSAFFIVVSCRHYKLGSHSGHFWWASHSQTCPLHDNRIWMSPVFPRPSGFWASLQAKTVGYGFKPITCLPITPRMDCNTSALPGKFLFQALFAIHFPLGRRFIPP
jgi:hypothetical protein